MFFTVRLLPGDYVDILLSDRALDSFAAAGVDSAAAPVDVHTQRPLWQRPAPTPQSSGA